MPIKSIVTQQKVARAKLERARQLRREMTPAERALWQELRGPPPAFGHLPQMRRLILNLDEPEKTDPRV